MRAITIQLDGSVLDGGSFTHFNGHLSSGVARLNRDGSLDLPFASNLGLHTNGIVYAIALQPDTRILLGGSFTSFSGVTRSNITRLNFDGTVDTSINFGGGANGYVGALAVQTDNNIVLGGGFTQVDGEPRSRLARIYGGSLGALNPSGSFEFTLPVFSYYKSDTNSMVTVRRQGGTAGTNVTVDFRTFDGTAVAGVNYLGVSNMCAVLSHNAGGYSFYKRAEHGRITRFRPNGVPLDRPGHYVYLRDDADGDYWSASWQPWTSSAATWIAPPGANPFPRP